MTRPFAPRAQETILLCRMLKAAAERGEREGFLPPEARQLSATLLAFRADELATAEDLERKRAALQETASRLADVAEHIDHARRDAEAALEVSTREGYR